MYYVGLDLGKRLDYSAIAVVERKEQEPLFDYLAWMQRQYAEREGLAVRYLERIQLGTPYTQVVERVVKTIERLRRKDKCRLVVDATGMVGHAAGGGSRARWDFEDGIARTSAWYESPSSKSSAIR